MLGSLCPNTKLYLEENHQIKFVAVFQNILTIFLCRNGHGCWAVRYHPFLLREGLRRTHGDTGDYGSGMRSRNVSFSTLVPSKRSKSWCCCWKWVGSLEFIQMRVSFARVKVWLFLWHSVQESDTIVAVYHWLYFVFLFAQMCVDEISAIAQLCFSVW